MVRRRGVLAGAVLLAVMVAVVGWRLVAAPARPGVSPSTATPDHSVRAERSPAQPGGVEAAPTSTSTSTSTPTSTSTSTSTDAAPPVRRPRPPVDVAGWERARVAFGFRELGRAGPYVKTGLDAARRDMAFCFSRGAAGEADAPADPTILTLYLEAREGAIDVVESAVDHRGAARPDLVECCREVLRGYEISAFGVVPGERYRLKYALE